MDEAFLCFALCSFIENIRKKIALLSAAEELGIVYQLKEDSFLSIAINSVQLQCLLEIEQFFDRAHFRNGEDNCSINLLKEYCLSDKTKQIYGEEQLQKFADRIDALCEEYKKVIPIEIRNKQMAHHDLKRLKEDRESQIVFSDERELVCKTTDVVSDILTTIIGKNIAEAMFPSLEGHIESFKKDIQKTISIESNPK